MAIRRRRHWKNQIFSLDSPTPGKIISVKSKREHVIKRLFAKRFLLGFRRLSGRNGLFDGRLFFLTSDFCARNAQENTRRSINAAKLPANGKQDLFDSPLPEAYSFLVITDPHLKIGKTRNFAAISNILLPSDAFLVVNGDLTQEGSREQLELFLSMANDFPLPVYPVIGNHDIYRHSWPTWQNIMGNTIYRIDSGTTTLIMLDSANGRFGQQQIRWLDKQLGEARSRIFIFSHCNFFIPRFSTFQQFAALWETTKIVNMLNGRVTAVFTGHSHKRHIHVAQSVPYINLDDFRHKSSFCRAYVTPVGIRYEYGNI